MTRSRSNSSTSAITKGPELFIGLVGAVGTDLRTVVEILQEQLRAVKYTPSEIRLSTLISDCYKYRNLKKTRDGPEDDRIDAHMDAGDDLRRTTNRGDAVALLAMNAIRVIREEKGNKPDQALPRYAYILNSLKHPDEVKTLSKTYGEAFFLISTYAPRNDRVARLLNKIAKSRHKYSLGQFKERADYLVEKEAIVYLTAQTRIVNL